MHVSRRSLLRGAAALPLAAVLASCGGTTIAGVVTVTQAALNAAAGIEAGFAGIKGMIPAPTQALITKAIDAAEAVMGGLTPGAIVPLTSVQNLFTDLETAQKAAASVLGDTPIVAAIGLALPILAALAQMAMPAAAAPGAKTPDDAVQELLTNLPYHGRILATKPS